MPGPPCSVGVLLADLPEGEAELLRLTLLSRARSSDISRALNAEVQRTSAYMVNFHRRGDCACPKD